MRWRAVGALRHQLVHVAQRLDGRIVLVLDVGRAEFARAGRAGCDVSTAQHDRRRTQAAAHRTRCRSSDIATRLPVSCRPTWTIDFGRSIIGAAVFGAGAISRKPDGARNSGVW